MFEWSEQGKHKTVKTEIYQEWFNIPNLEMSIPDAFQRSDCDHLFAL